MTVSTSVNRYSYAGNGTSQVFAYPRRIISESDIVVVLVSSSGVETVQTITSQYTVSGVGSDSGGSITMLTAPAVGQTLLIYTDPDLTQEVDYVANDPFPAETHEGALDKLTIIAQRLRDLVGRSIKVPEAEGDGPTIQTASDRAGKFLFFDGSGNLTTTAVLPSSASNLDVPTVLWSLVPVSSLDVSITTVLVTGYTAIGDAPIRVASVVTDGTTVQGDKVDSGGRRWRYDKGQISLENFGGKGDYDPLTGAGVTDNYDAFFTVAEWVNYWGGGCSLHLSPAKHYEIATPFKWDLGGVNGGAFASRTHTRADGRTHQQTPPNSETSGTQYPAMGGVDGFTLEGNGATVHCTVPAKLTSADYYDPSTTPQGKTPKTVPMMPFHFWKCSNISYKDVTFNGHWSDITSEMAGSGQRMAYGLRAVAGKKFTFDNVEWRDWAADATIVTHRYEGSLDSITMVDMEGLPEADKTTGSVYDPNGRSEDWRFFNCRTLYCGRNGHSPVGVFRWHYINGEISYTYVNQSASPLWTTGDPEGSGNTYQMPPTLPGAAVDFEPDRNAGEQCSDIKIINASVLENFLEFGALGDAGRIRVQTAFATTDVNTSTDTITMTACKLPRAIEGQENPGIRFFSTGTLPAGLARYTTYYISKVDANNFKVHRTFADAVAKTNAVDITDVGSGTHYAAVWKSIPCVDQFEIRGCHVVTSENSGGALLTGVSPVTLVTDCLIDIIDPTAQIKHLGVAGRGTTRFGNNRIRTVAQSFGNFPSKELKTLDGATDVQVGTDVFTDTGFSPDSSSDGMGRYEFTPVRVYSSSGTLPVPLEPQVVYYLTRLDADTFKLSYTLEDAEAGTYIDITAAGSGNFNVYWDYGHKVEITGNDIVGIGAQEDFPGRYRDRPFETFNVNPATDTIYSFRHGLRTNEQVRLLTWAGGTLPTGLATATTYYIIKVDRDNFKFAASSADSLAGIAVDITGAGSGRFRLHRNGTTLVDISGYVPCSFHGNRVFVPAEWNDGVTSVTVANLLNVDALTSNVFQTDLPAGSGLSFFASFGQTQGTGANTFVPELSWGIAGAGATQEISTCKQLYFSQSFTPVAVGAGLTSTQIMTVPGASINNHVAVTLPGHTVGLELLRTYTQANGVTFVWHNPTAGSLTPPAGTYRGVLTRTI